MTKPRQEFLGPITKLAQDGSGIIDGYGAEIHNVTMVVNGLATDPVVGPGRGSFWAYDNGMVTQPRFTDSEGNTYDIGSGGGSGNIGSGTSTLVDGYVWISTTIPADAQILWSINTTGGVPGYISVTNQSTAGFALTSTSIYDTSVINWIWASTTTIINNVLMSPMFAPRNLMVRVDQADVVAGSFRTASNVVDIATATAPGIGQSLVTVADDRAEWTSVVTMSGKHAAANQVLWHDGIHNVWTSTPKASSFSASNGVSIGPGNCVKFESLPASIGFVNTTSGTGNHLSITAQNSKLSGGNLNLSSGSGQTIGVVNIQTGGINAAVIGPGYLRNNGTFQQAELNSVKDASADTHITQGYDGRIATRLMGDYGLYTVVPKAYQQSTTYAPRRDKQFGGFSLVKEGAGGEAVGQVLSFSSTILGAKIPACRKIVGTFLVGYARTGGAGSSALYLLDSYSDASGNLTMCSLTAAAQKHNGSENDVLAVGSISSDSTFDITVTRPDSADPLEVVNYYWELNYGWA